MILEVRSRKQKGRKSQQHFAEFRLPQDALRKAEGERHKFQFQCENNFYGYRVDLWMEE